MTGTCPHCGKKIPMQKFKDEDGEEFYGAKKSLRTVHVTQVNDEGVPTMCFDRPKKRGE